MNRIGLLISFGVLAAVLTGCSLTRGQMLTDTAGYIPPVKPDANKALVYVVRPDTLGAIVPMGVFLDNKDDNTMQAGVTSGLTYLYFYAAPGTHLLYSKAENLAELPLALGANEVYYVYLRPEPGILFARNSLRGVDRIEGMYMLKRCKPGNIVNTNF